MNRETAITRALGAFWREIETIYAQSFYQALDAATFNRLREAAAAAVTMRVDVGGPRCADCNQLLEDTFHTGVFFHTSPCTRDRAHLLRIADEAHAVLTLEQLEEMGKSMDLAPDEVKRLLMAATEEWERVKAKRELEYLRGELRAGRISYDELHALQTLAKYIAPDDVELREAAGIPESATVQCKTCAGTGHVCGDCGEVEGDCKCAQNSDAIGAEHYRRVDCTDCDGTGWNDGQD